MKMQKLKFYMLALLPLLLIACSDADNNKGNQVVVDNNVAEPSTVANATQATPADRERPAAGGPPGGGEGGERPARGRGGMGMGMGGVQYDLTERALAEQAKYEQIYDNPSIQCDITNIFFGWTHDANVNQITQQDDTVTLLYGYMDFERTIHLNMDKHPENIVPSRGGHSIGRWEGKTLIVDTVGFTAGVLNPLSGEPHGTEMHAVEKFWYDEEAKTLNREYTVEAPGYLKTPFTNQDSQIISDLPYQPYDCTELSGENNRRPEDRTDSN